MSTTTVTQSDEDQPPRAPVGGPAGVGARRCDRPDSRLNPTFLAYLMGPVALLVILLLIHLGAAARESAWLWVGRLPRRAGHQPAGQSPLHGQSDARPAASPGGRPGRRGDRGHLPHAAGARCCRAPTPSSPSRTSRTGARGSGGSPPSGAWSAIAVGQVGVWQGVVPCELSLGQANALAVMGAFVLVFIIRMAGATMEQKEEAEASMRLSEDRFRSLIQNSSDATLVIGAGGDLHLREPGHPVAARPRAGRAGRAPRHRFRPPRRPGPGAGPARGPAADLPGDTRSSSSAWSARTAPTATSRRSWPTSGTGPRSAGYVANIRDITERKEFEALLAHRALHDPLTGLANRQLILDRAEQMLVRARRACRAGGRATSSTSTTSRTPTTRWATRPATSCCRSVAGRFSASAAGQRHRGPARRRRVRDPGRGRLARRPARDGRRAHHERCCATPFQVEGYEGLPITVTASIGIATGDRPSAQELLRDADIALYRAKAGGPEPVASCSSPPCRRPPSTGSS